MTFLGNNRQTCAPGRKLTLALSSFALAVLISACDGSDPDSTESSAPSQVGGAGPLGPEGKSVSSGSFYCAAHAVVADACQACHSDPTAGGAPMSLVAYADFTAAAPLSKGQKVYQAIKARIHDPKMPMPPQRKLTAAELGAIDAWIDDGAKPGPDPSCASQAAPKASQQPSVWPPEGSENCYKLTVPNTTVTAGSEPHPQFFFDAPWGDTQVQALGFRPISDNKKVLHHWILYSGTGAGGFLSGWAPGQDESAHQALPPEVGITMPSGKNAMRLDMHYYNLQGTSDEQDSSGTEVCVTSKLRPKPAGTYSGFTAIPILPPAQQTDIVGTCNVSLREPVFILSESPHAHQLATWMKFEVKRGGETITLHNASFNFSEQTSTTLEQPFELKNGDQVITTCRFNNTTSRTVTFGENTGNEMCFNFPVLYPLGALSCGAGLGGIGDLLGGLGGLFGGLFGGSAAGGADAGGAATPGGT